MTQPADLTAMPGEQIEFKLENKTEAEYYLEVLAADGSELGEGEAHGGHQAEFIAELAELADRGDHKIKVFADRQENQASSFTLKVTQ